MLLCRCLVICKTDKKYNKIFLQKLVCSCIQILGISVFQNIFAEVLYDWSLAVAVLIMMCTGEVSVCLSICLFIILSA